MLKQLDFVLLFVVVCCFRLSQCFECDLTTQFKCVAAEGYCVEESQVCNRVDDCGDGSDESRCSYLPADMTKALLCAVDENTVGTLVNLFGDPERYVSKLADNSNIDNTPIYIKFASDEHPNYFDPLSVIYWRQTLYFGRTLSHGLFVYGNDSNVFPTDVIPVANKTTAIAYDWVSYNLYWIDDDYKQIGVIPTVVLKGVYWKLLVTNLTHPKDLALHPTAHYLFWIDGAQIERADMTGSTRTVLLTSTDGLVAPIKLTVDYTAQRLYWLDAASETVGAINFDGSNITTWSDTAFGYYSAMTIHSKYFYFGDTYEPQLSIHDKADNLTYITSYSFNSLGISEGRVTDLDSFSAQAQPVVTGPCTWNNGGCSQLCFPVTSSIRSCGCAAGFFLSTDGTTCTIRPFPTKSTFLLVADDKQKNIYAVNPNTGELRALLSTATCSPAAITFDPKLSILYWTCTEPNSYSENLYRLRRKSFDGRILSTLVAAQHVNSQWLGMALDSERGRVYYTDKTYGIITEIRVNDTQTRVVNSDQNTSPTAIVIDTSEQRLYWVDAGLETTIRSIKVDGSDLKTLVAGAEGTEIAALTIDFDNRILYWAVNGIQLIAMMSLNETNGNVTVLLDITGPVYTGLTLLDQSLYISDSKSRFLWKFNLTSGKRTAQFPALFTSALDVKYFNTSSELVRPPPTPPSSTVSYLCSYRLINMSFTETLSDKTSFDYRFLNQTLHPIMVGAFVASLDNLFVNISSVSFSAGSVVVDTTVQLTTTPTTQQLNATTTTLYAQLVDNNFIVDRVDMVLQTSPTTRVNEATSTITTPVSAGGIDSNWKIIVGVVVGVGGFLVLVIIIVVIAVCVYVNKIKSAHLIEEKGLAQTGGTNPIYSDVETYDEINDNHETNLRNKMSSDVTSPGYEPLRRNTENNYIDSPAKPQPPPERPDLKPGDDDTYLKPKQDETYDNGVYINSTTNYVQLQQHQHDAAPDYIHPGDRASRISQQQSHKGDDDGDNKGVYIHTANDYAVIQRQQQQHDAADYIHPGDRASRTSQSHSQQSADGAEDYIHVVNEGSQQPQATRDGELLVSTQF